MYSNTCEHLQILKGNVEQLLMNFSCFITYHILIDKHLDKRFPLTYVRRINVYGIY